MSRSTRERVDAVLSSRTCFDPSRWPEDDQRALLAKEERLAARYARDTGRPLVWRPGNLGRALMDDIAKVRRGK